MSEDVLFIQKTRELMTTGWLNGWLGLAAALGLGLLVCLQLYWELQQRKGMIWPARAILVVRVLIVSMAVWLLCQPLLLVTTRWQLRPELLILVGSHSSMKAREEFGQLYRKIDVIEILESQPIENRNPAASGLSRRLSQLQAVLDRSEERLQVEADRMASGLPPAPDLERFFQGLASSLSKGRDDLARLQSLLPDMAGHEALQSERAAFLNQLQLFSSACQGLEQEAGLVGKEAAAHPDLLEKFLKSSKEAKATAAALQAGCEKMQASHDEALLAPEILEACRSRVLSRGALADLSTARIQKNIGDRLRVSRRTASTREEGLRDAMARQLQSPVAAILILDDGTLPLSEAERDLAATLGKAGLPVHAVLAGADGIEPEDCGIVAVDMPGVAVAGKKVAARALVKARLSPDRKCRLVALEGPAILAEKDLPADGGTAVCELSFSFAAAGRHAIVLETRAYGGIGGGEEGGGGPDSFEGNERFATTVDVFASRPRILIKADTLSLDFALYQSVAQALPYLQVEALLADPDLGKLEAGEGPGRFPATEDQWKGITLAVLLGSVPEGLSESALAALKSALDGGGLNVLVQPGDKTRSWADALEVPGRALQTPPQRLLPRPDVWLPLYGLRKNEVESSAAWFQLPEARPGVQCPITPGIPLFDGGDEAPIQAILHGHGILIYNGLPSMAALRDRGNAGAVNRIVAGLLELGVRPWRESPRGPVVFPAQPVAGRQILVVGFEGHASLEAGVERAGETPPGTLLLRVTGEKEALFQAGEERFQRPVHKLLGPADFELTAHADPLRELAKLGKGTYAELLDLPALVSQWNFTPADRLRRETYRLWTGIWPLGVMLLLVSAEYLLRRRAGRVM